MIGPGTGIFTHFAKVLEYDDSAMSVKTAHELEANFDAETHPEPENQPL
jgi:putative DNA methylase